jgi:hypothetical protein
MHWTCVVCPWHEVCLEAFIYDSLSISPCGLMVGYHWTITIGFRVQWEPEYVIYTVYKTLQLEQ